MGPGGGLGDLGARKVVLRPRTTRVVGVSASAAVSAAEAGVVEYRAGRGAPVPRCGGAAGAPEGRASIRGSAPTPARQIVPLPLATPTPMRIRRPSSSQRIDNLAVGFAPGTCHVGLPMAAAVVGAVSVLMPVAGWSLGARNGTRAGQPRAWR